MSNDSIIFLDSVLKVAPAELQGFFAGWPKAPTPETLLRILQNSEHCVVAYDTTAKKVIGFVNCISDGILSAYIPLLEVLPQYQNRGIGKELVTRMLERTKEYYMTDTCCDEDLIPFYQKFGMEQSTGMIRRNYKRQSGSTNAE